MSHVSVEANGSWNGPTTSPDNDTRPPELSRYSASTVEPPGSVNIRSRMYDASHDTVASVNWASMTSVR